MIVEIVLVLLCIAVLKLNIGLILYLVLCKKRKKKEEQIISEVEESPEDHLLGFRNLFSKERGETI